MKTYFARGFPITKTKMKNNTEVKLRINSFAFCAKIYATQTTNTPSPAINPKNPIDFRP
jgi:hypothetical protein